MTGLRTLPARLAKKIVVGPKGTGCWQWIGASHYFGYGSIMIAAGQNTTAHRASWLVHYGPIPDGMHVLHRCDNPPCTNPKHLWLGTNAENAEDRRLKGRGKGGPSPGEANHFHVLTERKVRKIRTDKRPTNIVASQYGVHPDTIRLVRNRKIWKHLP